MNFDTALMQYQEKRAKLRESQGELSKLLIERQKLDKMIKAEVRKYTVRYGEFIAARDELAPTLNLEVASAEKPEHYEAKLAEETEAKRIIDSAAQAVEKEADNGAPVTEAPADNEPADTAENGKADQNGQT